MPIKKGLKKKIKGLRPTVASSLKKTTKKGKGNVSQSVVVNINKGRKVSSVPSNKPTIASSLLSGLTSLASALKSKNVAPSTTLKDTNGLGVVKSGEPLALGEEKVVTPIPTEVVTKNISTPISLGRLKIDESVLNKFTQSKQSIPAKMDMPDVPPFKYKPIGEYFQPSPLVEIPKKKDSKVKKLVTSIENRRMGEEDKLARQIQANQIEAKKAEETRQRQQAKIDYFNRQLPFSQSEDITYKPSIPLAEVEGIPLVEAEVRAKRPYVKSGKYSKKKSESGVLSPLSNIIPEEE